MTDMQDRELWSIAVFRLREAANRIFALATRVRAPRVRSRLLDVYEQLRTEESELAALAEATFAKDEAAADASAASESAVGRVRARGATSGPRSVPPLT